MRTRYDYGMTLIGNDVLVCGGYNVTTYVSTCELYNSALGMWLQDGVHGRTNNKDFPLKKLKKQQNLPPIRPPIRPVYDRTSARRHIRPGHGHTARSALRSRRHVRQGVHTGHDQHKLDHPDTDAEGVILSSGDRV
ncbi:unnamed protein product [Sphagnum balticum]